MFTPRRRRVAEMSAVQEYRESLPVFTCPKCKAREISISRKRLKLKDVEGEVVINQLECSVCGEVITILP